MISHGWERFGEYNDNNFLNPFIEGAWMNKHNGKYYLQYGGPGTEISGYGDGVYVSDHPLGPFTYQASNPFSYKPGGFARGAGHGSTYQDPFGNWWHISTMVVNVKNNFERRIGIWPAGFDSMMILWLPIRHLVTIRSFFRQKKRIISTEILPAGCC